MVFGPHVLKIVPYYTAKRIKRYCTERKALSLLYLGVTHTTMSSAVPKLTQVRTHRYPRVLTLRAMHNLSGDYYKTLSRESREKKTKCV